MRSNLRAMSDQWLPGAVKVPGESAGTHAAGAGSKILHHTTEGGSASGAISAYRSTRSWPTLTAEWTGTRLATFEHIPLNLAARALEHPSGPETNRANVVQIEHVGFTDDAYRAHVGADPALHVSRWPDARWAAIGAMCREIEALRDCPRTSSIPQARWDRPAGWRQGGQEFFDYRGHTAHVFVPGNHHLDGTGFRIEKVLAFGGDDRVYRTLRLNDSGPDVTAFQLATRLRALRCGRPDRAPLVDGRVGPQTLTFGAFMAYVLGVGNSQSELMDGGLSATVQSVVRDPSGRSMVQKRRATARRAKHCKG